MLVVDLLDVISDQHWLDNMSDSNGTNGTNGVASQDGPSPLPSAKAFRTSSSVTIQPPLTRRGYGPGLILLVPLGLDLNGSDKTLDPPPLQKWAEEGWAVAQITLADGEDSKFQAHLKHALVALGRMDECESTDSVGLICKSPGLTYKSLNSYRCSVQYTFNTRVVQSR